MNFPGQVRITHKVGALCRSLFLERSAVGNWTGNSPRLKFLYRRVPALKVSLSLALTGNPHLANQTATPHTESTCAKRELDNLPRRRWPLAMIGSPQR